MAYVRALGGVRAMNFGGLFVSFSFRVKVVGARGLGFGPVLLVSRVVFRDDAELGGLLDPFGDGLFEERIVLVAFRPLVVVLLRHVLLHVVAERKFLRRVRLAAHFAVVSEMRGE